jgi:Zn-dependent protease
MDADVSQIIQRIAVTFPAFLLALVVHEFAHALIAKFYGDETAAWEGRLSLNPLVHIDPIGTVLMPLLGCVFGGFMFGWAKPVPIDPRKFRSYRAGLFWVSFAGPLSNILFGFVAALAWGAVARYLPADFSFHDGAIAFLQSLVAVNFMLAVFNLLPIPPMDGSNIVLSFLSYNATRKFQELQQYSFILMILLMFTGAFRIITIPVSVLIGLAEIGAKAVFGLA